MSNNEIKEDGLCSTDLPVKLHIAQRFLAKYLVAGSRVLSNTTTWEECSRNQLRARSYKSLQGPYVALNPRLVIIKQSQQLKLHPESI